MPIFDLIFHSVGGPKLRKWYGAPDPYAEDGSNLEEADKSSGNLPEILNSFFFFHL